MDFILWFIVDSSTQTITLILTGTTSGLILTSSNLTLHFTLYTITMTVFCAPICLYFFIFCLYFFIFCLYFFNFFKLFLLLYNTTQLLSLGNKHSCDSVKKKIPQCSFEEVILMTEGTLFIRYFFPHMNSWTLMLWKGEKQWKLRRLFTKQVAAQQLTHARILGRPKKKSNLITGAGKYTDGYYTY